MVLIQALAGGVGIPFVRWFGTECDYVSSYLMKLLMIECDGD
jgi:hypothetical protein